MKGLRENKMVDLDIRSYALVEILEDPSMHPSVRPELRIVAESRYERTVEDAKASYAGNNQLVNLIEVAVHNCATFGETVYTWCVDGK